MEEINVDLEARIFKHLPLSKEIVNLLIHFSFLRGK